MTSFSDVFEQFLVRDVLGYIMPGCVAATALAFCAPVDDVDHLVVTAGLAKLSFASVVVFYVCGFACSAIGDLVGEPRKWFARRAQVNRATEGAEADPDTQEDPKEVDASIADDVVASGLRVSRRYVARLYDIGLLNCNMSVALFAVVVARILLAHKGYAVAAGNGPFASVYRCMTVPVIVAMLAAAFVLLWYGHASIRDADNRTAFIAAKIAEARRVNGESGTPPTKAG